MDKIKKNLDIIATVSHEIRTPLNAIIGMTQILRDKNLTPEQQQCVDIIQISGENLLTLINDLLDYSKLAAHKLEIKQIPFDIKQLIDQVCKMFQYKLSEKQLDLIVEYRGDIPPQVLGDETRIRQVLLNLLSNAAKFTEKGQIKIIIENQPNQNSIQFTVADTGIGIAEQHLEMIFERFAQVDSLQNSHEGAGLGLAIAKSLVEAMKGKIGVNSQPHQGSQFWFTLPLKSVVATPKSPHKTSAFIRNYAPKILVVEDNKLNQKVIQIMLKELGCQIDLTYQGDAALELLQKNHYDLIFMDIELPGMNGFETIQAIRQLKNNNKQTAIIALTAHAAEENFNNCIRAGADNVLTKPILLDALVNILNQYVPKNSLGQ